MSQDRTLVAAAFVTAALFCFAPAAAAQSKRREPVNGNTSPAATPLPTPQNPVVEDAQPERRTKKNERPVPGAGQSGAKGQRPVNARDPVYFYEFTHPNFIVRKVVIEHDENGLGKIAFIKRGYTEPISDPIEVSPAAMERLKKAFAALNFLDSKEDYQYQKDFSHLGVMKITMRKDGRERTSEFNWTDNKDAKAITEEYRKLGNQYIWMFDINLARENQPLQAPGLLDELDSLVRRSEISDAGQMLLFLQKLTEDERVPLIARNHAARIIKTIEKARR